MTIRETAAACQANFRWSFIGLPEARLKKIGAAPGGSRITNKVTKA